MTIGAYLRSLFLPCLFALGLCAEYSQAATFEFPVDGYFLHIGQHWGAHNYSRNTGCSLWSGSCSAGACMGACTDNATRSCDTDSSCQADSTCHYKKHLAQDVRGMMGGGTAVKAAADGVVRYARVYGSPCDVGSCRNAWGGIIVIEHQLSPGDSYGPIAQTIYGHLDPHFLVAEGDTVVMGQMIGAIGKYASSSCSTDMSWADHLHFGVYTGAFGMLVIGQCGVPYPPWLRGYQCSNTFPGNYVDPEAFVQAHAASGQSFFDDFNRPDGSTVGNGWSQYAVGGSTFIQNSELRLTSPPGGTNTCPCGSVCNCYGAKIFRPLPQQSGVRVTGRFIVNNSFSRFWVHVRADGATSLRNGYGFDYRLDQADNELRIGDITNDGHTGPFLAEMDNLPFSIGQDVTFEMLVFADNSIEVRFWPTGSSRPADPTASLMGPYTPASSGSNLALILSTPDSVNADVSFDDIGVSFF